MFKNKFFDFSKGEKTKTKTIIVGAMGILSGLYLFNLTWGGIEFLPDNIPFIGNIDEATATLLLIGSLKYFGIDLIEMFTGIGKTPKDSEIDNQDPSQPRYVPPSN
ncbi:MAG: hypothetical protein SFU25_01310 [Candidatus Caenarcaniphilales bacterium]|nr:hypothetical protein [Candidatus Caenarcaniphilales bacterium]